MRLPAGAMEAVVMATVVMVSAAVLLLPLVMLLGQIDPGEF